MKNIFIGPSVRSGGSLINRLFDAHPDVGSYPFELYLPMDTSLHWSQKDRGQKLNVQNFPSFLKNEPIDIKFGKMLLNTNQSKCLVGKHFKDGKLIAKTSGLDIDCSFDHSEFIHQLGSIIENQHEIAPIYDSLHQAFFEHWDEGTHSGKMEYIIYHSGNGLLADIEMYLNKFPNSYFIQPIRDVRGYLASEKKKVFRQLAGRGKIGRKINWPDSVLKHYYGRYFESMLVNWLITFTRSVILKERLGDRYIVYKHEDLVRNTKKTMESICSVTGIKYDECLINPTVGGVDWMGNSMFGLHSGVNPKLADVRDVFNPLEDGLIKKYCGAIIDYLASFENVLVDYDKLSRESLFDYSIQAKYYDDREKTALYFASMYERWAYDSVYNQIKGAITMHTKPLFLKV